MTPKKILIVEDDKLTVTMLQSWLKNEGFNTFTASDGQEGLNLARQLKPDLIISDVIMPVMDGYAFYKELKKNSDTASIPLVVISARKKMEDSFIAMGAKKFISKPFQGNQLIEAVNEFIQLPSLQKSKQDLMLTETTNRPLSVASTPTSLASKKVLIIGTDPIIVDQLSNSLMDENCITEVVRTNDEIYSTAGQFRPDIIIIEVYMEGVSAYEFILELQKKAEFKKVPFFVYTYYPEDKFGLLFVLDRPLSTEMMITTQGSQDPVKYLGMFHKKNFGKLMAQYLG